MKATLASILAATLLWGCGGGGGNPGTCSGSPQYCAEFAEGPDLPAKELFAAGGTGDTVLTLPAGIQRLRIQGSPSLDSQNFNVSIDGVPLVNELVGTTMNPSPFDGTYLVTGTTVAITNSVGVHWGLSEVLPEAPVTGRTGTGDMVFDLASTVRRVRIQATYPGSSQNFIVRIAGTEVVNTLVGSAETPSTHETVVLLGAGGTVEVLGAHGVTWIIQEEQP